MTNNDWKIMQMCDDLYLCSFYMRLMFKSTNTLASLNWIRVKKICVSW